jgi:MarR family transcriptional regulator for hemolysin
MDEQPFSHPGHYINRIARLGARWTEPRLQKLGLATAQVPVFGALRNMGPLSQKDLAKLFHVEQPTMAQLLARMERDGLIQRTPDPNDGRSSLISLTPLALKKAIPARNVLLEGNKAALRGFTDRETATLTRLLKRIVTNLEEELGDTVDPVKP